MWPRRRRKCDVCLEPLSYLGRTAVCEHCDLGACFNPVCPACRLTFGAGTAALTELRRTPPPWELTVWERPPLSDEDEDGGL